MNWCELVFSDGFVWDQQDWNDLNRKPKILEITDAVKEKETRGDSESLHDIYTAKTRSMF